MQKASDTIECRRLFVFCDFYFLGRLGRIGAVTFLAPAFVIALLATIGHLFLPRVELYLLRGSQDIANFRRLLSANGLAALHYLASLFEVAASCGSVPFLAGSTGRVDERLGLGAERLILGLILLADRLDLRLLGVSQIEIGHEVATGSAATAEFSAGAWLGLRSGGRLSNRDSRYADEHHGAKRQ